MNLVREQCTGLESLRDHKSAPSASFFTRTWGKGLDKQHEAGGTHITDRMLPRQPVLQIQSHTPRWLVEDPGGEKAGNVLHALALTHCFLDHIRTQSKTPLAIVSRNAP